MSPENKRDSKLHTYLHAYIHTWSISRCPTSNHRTSVACSRTYLFLAHLWSLDGLDRAFLGFSIQLVGLYLVPANKLRFSYCLDLTGIPYLEHQHGCLLLWPDTQLQYTLFTVMCKRGSPISQALGRLTSAKPVIGQSRCGTLSSGP